MTLEETAKEFIRLKLRVRHLKDVRDRAQSDFEGAESALNSVKHDLVKFVGQNISRRIANLDGNVILVQFTGENTREVVLFDAAGEEIR